MTVHNIEATDKRTGKPVAVTVITADHKTLHDAMATARVNYLNLRFEEVRA